MFSDCEMINCGPTFWNPFYIKYKDKDLYKTKQNHQTLLK